MITPGLRHRFPSRRHAWRARCAGLIALLLHLAVIHYLLHATGVVTRDSRPDQARQQPLQLLTLILQAPPDARAARESAARRPPAKPALADEGARRASGTISAPAAQALNALALPHTVAPPQAISVAPAQASTSAGTSATPNWRSDLDAVAQPRHNFAQQPSWMTVAPASAPQAGNQAMARFGRTVSQGARADCQSAYRPLGLLAIPKLLLDTATNTGCRWN